MHVRKKPQRNNVKPII